MTKQLYMDGNGRVTCGDLRCAGMTAHASGMKYDLNGAAFEKCDVEAVRYFESLNLKLKCESCHAEQSLLVTI